MTAFMFSSEAFKVQTYLTLGMLSNVTTRTKKQPRKPRLAQPHAINKMTREKTRKSGRARG